MMRIDWSPLDEAMDGRAPVFWWRDDDAIEPSPALDRLLGLAASVGAPLTLASIPAHTTTALAKRIAHDETITVAVHGWTHESHAPQGEKNMEFGPHRPLSNRVGEAERGLRIIGETFGKNALPVFIPPWNRMADDMPNALNASGYRGVSVYGERRPSADPLPRFDAHLDPVDWRDTRSAVDPAAFIARICGLLQDDAPIGLMTHHLVHDDAIWSLVEETVKRLTAGGARWVGLSGLLDSMAPGPMPTGTRDFTI